MPDQMAMMSAMWNNPMMRMQMMGQMQPWMGMMGHPMGMMGMVRSDHDVLINDVHSLTIYYFCCIFN
jgi:hypothetical protein